MSAYGRAESELKYYYIGQDDPIRGKKIRIKIPTLEEFTRYTLEDLENLNLRDLNKTGLACRELLLVNHYAGYNASQYDPHEALMAGIAQKIVRVKTKVVKQVDTSPPHMAEVHSLICLWDEEPQVLLFQSEEKLYEAQQWLIDNYADHLRVTEIPERQYAQVRKLFKQGNTIRALELLASEITKAAKGSNNPFVFSIYVKPLILHRDDQDLSAIWV